MNRDVFSNTEFSSLREQLNQEILRRGTFRWWDPLTTPTVGQDRTPPLSLPAVAPRVPVDDRTYTINNPSEGSIEETRNIRYPAHGEFPAGEEPGTMSPAPSTSAAQVNADEMRNALVGLAKIHDINLFYGRDEVKFLAFRDPQGIEDILKKAQADELSLPLMESDIPAELEDPNGGLIDRKHDSWPHRIPTEYPIEQGKYVMPSGERDGEEAFEPGLGPENFFDDHGAPEGVGDFHPYNPAYSATPNRDWDNQGRDRGTQSSKIHVGGIPSAGYGPNPRNPVQGESYPSRPVYGGVATSCNVACTGLCYLTCDNQCSESCTTTCWNRCGEACTASCGNVCTGCTTMCYNTCKTKCENSTGYSCLKAGAKTVKITASGGKDGIPAKNELTTEIYTCNGCAYTCQFYPNKKTSCWDAACMGKCFNTCESSCSTSCYGGCIDNTKEEGSSYKTGHGRGCSGGCTLNCVGRCSGVCAGYCVQTCWHACKATCSDNCAWTCSNDCGTGCEIGCTNGCETNCVNHLESGTSCNGGCESTCEHGCSNNCVAIGCRSICGTGSADACEANCRLNCMSTSCTAMCSDACSSECTTCVNTCGWQCGACTSNCSTGCEAECNITCSATCEHSCETNCVHSCEETCGGCSNLCYSCVGMCIGICSVKCEAGCTNCTNNCSWWCDNTCGRSCFSNCSNRCITNCSGSCSTFLMSETTMTAGPERDPISDGYRYPHPRNRWEERESFKLFQDIAPYRKPRKKDPLVTVEINKERNITVYGEIVDSFTAYQTSIDGGIYSTTEDGKIHINLEMLTPEVEANSPNADGGDAIWIIVIRTPGTILTREDILYRVPIGFRGYFYSYDEDGNAVVVIERDVFLYPPESCDCDQFVEMTEDEFMAIWEERRKEIQSEDGGFIVGMTEEGVHEIWNSDNDPYMIPPGPECGCGNMYEISIDIIMDIWDPAVEGHDCDEYEEMTDKDLNEIWNGERTEIPSEQDGIFHGMTEGETEKIWKSDEDPRAIDSGEPCECGDMYEIDIDSAEDAWKDGMNDE